MTNDTHAGKICRIPGAGWKCTRNAGHEGPCAAEHDHNFSELEALKDENERLKCALEPFALKWKPFSHSDPGPESRLSLPERFFKQAADALSNTTSTSSRRSCEACGGTGVSAIVK